MSWTRRDFLTASAATALTLAGCTATQPEPAPEPTGSPPSLPSPLTTSYTHVQDTGNRRVAGPGSVADVAPVELSVQGRPAWLLATGETDSYWTVVTADGTATTHRVSDGGSEQVADHGTVSSPPLGYRSADEFGVVDPPADCAEYSHPVVLGDGVCYVAADGDVVIWRDAEPTRLDVGALVDARLVRIDDGRYAVYGARTDRYRHGVLGDAIEAGSVAIIDTGAERIETEISLAAPTVFEGHSPMVADLDGDGSAELITTVSDSEGARIRVYRTDGTELATGPIYGSGWRHQLCVAPFGPDGGSELAVLRKPHVDRTVEFYRLSGGELSVVATRQGYTTHSIGSRNLDGAIAGDFDSDGQPELLVPTTAQQTLAALGRTASGVEEAWSLSLGGQRTTNVTGVGLGEDRVAVGAGTSDGVRIWQG